ncbi:hypothetical protein NEFER03_1456 [Nematocida sp. LUAm3]|nr:hypothetical protein NEFER03_1456 [Nematocida sp. LUAm3]KAI5174714.1 hypothetical protein NEFER02_0824 [Nematocida sp. LUAm2]KAI5177875.1 hypothetical protein NEFER01_1077 [Nematocida sp. LUAm1]
MKGILKREKRRNHEIIYTWKIFIAIMMLFSVVLSTETNRDGSTEAKTIDTMCPIVNDNNEHNTSINKEAGTKNKSSDSVYNLYGNMYEKKGIAKILLNYFYIKLQTSKYITSEHNVIAVKDLCRMMKYVKEEELYYIDLKHCYVTSDGYGLEPLNYEMVDELLKKIGGIRCKFLYINKYVPLKFIEVLIRIIVVDWCLYIDCSNWNLRDSYTHGVSNNTECKLRNILSKTEWDEPTLCSLSLTNCCDTTIKTILNCIGTRKIEEIVIDSSSMQEIDVKRINIINECFFVLLNMASIKRIPFLEVKEKLSINSKSAPSNASSDSNAVKDSLRLDRATLKSLVNAYKETETMSERKVLQVKNLHLEYMPYTFQEIASVSHSPWIRIENLIIHADICNNRDACDFCNNCDFCDIHKEELIIEENLLNIVKKMGIQYLTTPCYEIVKSDSKYWSNKSVLLRPIIKNMPEIAGKVHNIHQCCYNKHAVYIISPFEIHLEYFKEHQQTLANFQSKHDIISAYMKYDYITIHGTGSESPENDIILLDDIIKCGGPRIKLYALAFHNMDGVNDLDTKDKNTQITQPSILPKTKFVLSELYFYYSKVDFIISMLTKYSYAPDASIYIDCENIETEDVVRFCQKILKHKFFKIFLENAAKLIKEGQEKTKYPDCYIRRNTVDIPLRNFQWQKKYPLLFKLLFQEKQHDPANPMTNK